MDRNQPQLLPELKGALTRSYFRQPNGANASVAGRGRYGRSTEDLRGSSHLDRSPSEPGEDRQLLPQRTSYMGSVSLLQDSTSSQN